jgi:hypothetical protein
MRRKRNARALFCRKAKIAEFYPALWRRAQALVDRVGGKQVDCGVARRCAELLVVASGAPACTSVL